MVGNGCGLPRKPMGGQNNTKMHMYIHTY